MNINVGDGFPLLLKDYDGNLWRFELREGIWHCQCDDCQSAPDQLRERCRLADLIREYGPISVPS